MPFNPEKFTPKKEEKQEKPAESIESKKAIERTDIEREKSIEAPHPFEGGIIVFGHGWSREAPIGGGWQLSPEAKMRTIAAYQLWKEGLAPRIILTGGEPREEDKQKYGPNILSNAEQMARMLKKRFNVPEEAIEIETESIKTVDNVAHALNTLEKKGLPTDNFVTVSTGYHLDRITEIMKKFNLSSRPISAEQALNDRAKEHAEKMRQRERKAGLDEEEIERRYLMRKNRYDKVIHRIYRNNETIQQEFKNEEKWLRATKEMPGYWLPLALAVKGEKLKEIVEKHREDIEEWLERHPDIELTIEDLIQGNFDYRELVKKGREMPPEE